MTKKSEKIINWNEAQAHLEDVTQRYLDEGSFGVQNYMDRVKPLWYRFNSGERTEELYAAIMKLN
jgi:hypothetical protein